MKEYYTIKYKKEIVSLDKNKALSKEEYIKKEIKTLYIELSQLR